MTQPWAALEGLSEDQKEYLAGFATGAGLAVAPQANQPTATAAPVEVATGPDRWLRDAQQRCLANGGVLVNEEKAKWERHPLDRWDEVVARSRDKVFPKGVDVFLAKSYGIFYVAPAQNSYMCRMRLPGGMITSHQMAGVANLADELAGGYAHVTTRANLQLRELSSSAPAEVVVRLSELGILTRGAGADNIRNVTASPTAGFDPQEWYDTSSLARQMHHYIANHREMYHLPRKFNIAFDGGGVISTLADTNDIGFAVTRVDPDQSTPDVPAGVYFRVQLGGITGHLQFASDVGWLIKPAQCIEMAAAIVRVFIANGDRTDRKKARLKYLIDRWGLPKFLEEVRKELPFEPTEFAIERCSSPPPPLPGSHLGIQPQSTPGKYFVGVVIPVGYMTSDDMRNLARIANRYGTGQLRLTCWQNVLIPGIDQSDIDTVQEELRSAGFDWQPHSIRAGLVACTGNAGCKFAASDTKRHAMQIAAHIEQVMQVDQPLNLHLTGCHNSCAQHYIGDIGLIGAKVEVPVYQIAGTQTTAEASDDEQETQEVEGYHLFVGGGFGVNQGTGRELLRDVAASDLPTIVERILRGYLERRAEGESFVDFTRRHEIEQLRDWFGVTPSAVE
ncbi:MAG: NirA family protein [Planctomycetaceae bacterium]